MWNRFTCEFLEFITDCFLKIKPLQIRQFWFGVMEITVTHSSPRQKAANTGKKHFPKVSRCLCQSKDALGKEGLHFSKTRAESCWLLSADHGQKLLTYPCPRDCIKALDFHHKEIMPPGSKNREHILQIVEEFTEHEGKAFGKKRVKKEAFIYVGKFVSNNLMFSKPASQNVYYVGKATSMPGLKQSKYQKGHSSILQNYLTLFSCNIAN